MPEPKLTADDRASLETLEKKLQHIRDGVRGVAKHYSTGLVLWGEGGTSKSYTVMEELQSLKKVQFVLHNTRLTGRGLVDALDRFPDQLHVIEDCETLLDDKKAFGVLRSALWSQSRKKPMERLITWGAFKTEIKFVFTGGIIMIANMNMADSVPELRAIKTRIRVMETHLDQAEILALMKRICLEGYRYGEDYMTPSECWGVGEFIVEKLSEANRPLDLRLLQNGFKDYLQWKSRDAKNHWHDLLLTRMRERTITPMRRSELTAKESELAAELSRTGKTQREIATLWKEKTGKTIRAYYRALKRL